MELSEAITLKSWSSYKQAEADLHTCGAYQAAKHRAKLNGQNLIQLQHLADMQRLPFYQILLRLGISQRTASDHKNLAIFWDQAKQFWDRNSASAPAGRTWESLSMQDVIVMGRFQEWPEERAAKEHEATAKKNEATAKKNKERGAEWLARHRASIEDNWQQELSKLRATAEEQSVVMPFTVSTVVTEITTPDDPMVSQPVSAVRVVRFDTADLKAKMSLRNIKGALEDLAALVKNVCGVVLRLE